MVEVAGHDAPDMDQLESEEGGSQGVFWFWIMGYFGTYGKGRELGNKGVMYKRDPRFEWHTSRRGSVGRWWWRWH